MALSSASMGWTWVSAQHITSTGRTSLPMKFAPDLDAVAAHVHDRAAPGDLLVPEPGAVRSGVRLAGAGPQYLAHRACATDSSAFSTLGVYTRSSR